MKKLIAPLLTCAAIAVLLIGCAKDTTEPNTTVDDRDKFTGSWLCKETSSKSSTSTFTISVSKSTTAADELLISNFYNTGAKNSATVKVNKSNLTIPAQVYSGFNLSGQGASTGASSFSMTYAIGSNSSSMDNVSAECIKQ